VHGEEALCASGGHRYPIVDGIPVFVDERALAANPQYAGQRAYFDAEFRGYGRYSLEPWRVSYIRRLEAARMLEGPLVDLGVGGSGYTVIEAARRGQPAVGCDLSLEGLRAARRFAADEGLGERTLWICCSAEQLPLAGESFASALAIALLEHVPDDAAVLRELRRVLRPGGRAWVTVPHGLRNISPVWRRANRRHDRRLGHLRRYEAEGLAEAAREAGLTAVEAQFTGHSVKVAQLVGRWLGDRFWWWCERRDLERRNRRRGSMQLSMLLARPA
jgi:ubiquinone/menaquinone biosynthesis C-methylase UbiE